MSCLPNVTIIGDKTGGGSGMPFTSELPNGWTVRFSASPHFSVDMEQIEWGIDPDIEIDMDETDEAKHIDTIIEKPGLSSKANGLRNEMNNFLYAFACKTDKTSYLCTA